MVAVPAARDTAKKAGDNVKGAAKDAASKAKDALPDSGEFWSENDRRISLHAS